MMKTKRAQQTTLAQPHHSPTSTTSRIMRYPEFHYHWEYILQADPETLWPLVADTNRFNRDTGIPAVQRSNNPGEVLLNARRRLRLSRFGVPVEWEEEPFEWVRPYKHGVKRRYSKGPVGEMTVLTELIPLDAERGGTKLVTDVRVRPRNLFGILAIPGQVGILNNVLNKMAYQRYDKLAVNGQTTIDIPGPAEFVPGGRDRLKRARAAMLTDGAQPDIVDRLVDTIEHRDDITLARIRPYELADHWDVSRRSVLENTLLATRHGMLELQWDVLCPMCRGAKLVSPTLGKIQNTVHCDTCNIDFGVNFERSVELTFRPNAAIRHTELGEFCIAGPQTTPHVAVQQLIPAGASRTVRPALEPGRYRLRTLALRGSESVLATDVGLAEATLRASTLDGWPNGELELSPTPELTLKNATDSEQLFILERTAWSDQAATAAEVTVLQTFRDLFANEALRPGEQISVGSLTIVFTDLRGSTRLYNEIGDAPAFGLVMSHFDVLRAAINAEDGAIVKTIGDAVMAVFRRPAPALRAMLNAQSMLSEAGEGERGLRLRAGIHFGPCIAVTLNDRLDYFGSTVNLAARLEGFSSGGNVIISDVVRSDPEVMELLDNPDSGLTGEPFQTQLKGFATDYALWRVSLAGANMTQTTETNHV
ncbi:MAG: adenylate/guanylate cyclase domain-containing protein [Chloroflexota bacterium]